MSDDHETNPFATPHSFADEDATFDGTGVLLQAISALSKVSLISLLGMIPCGLLAQMGVFPMWGWLVPAFLFFVPLVLAAALVVVLAVVETIKWFFATDDSKND